MQLAIILSLLHFLSIVSAYTNLFDNGLKGPLLGTSFGIPGANATFDYVVVGGGTAGLTIATRLAAEPSVSVAVIEAGGFYEIDNGNLSVIPGSSIFFTGSEPSNFQPLVDWGFETTPQTGSNNRTMHYARGKTLGGSSARNYLLYQRGTIDSYQRWADEVDDQSYAWEAFLPYLQKSVHYTSPNVSLYTNASNLQTPDAFSAAGGPLQVSFSNSVDAFGTWASKLSKALVSLGMTEIDGFNSGHLLGSAYATITVDPRNAHRSSSESSFLQTALQNGTAPTIYKNSLAQRILFSDNKSATGVRVTTAGTFGTPSVNFTLNARKEVIVSAGAFQSPQFLMVSGIGPCANLTQFNISCISNLPGVGQNMWDHPTFGTSHRVDVLTASAALDNATLAALNAQHYLASASGPLSVYGPAYYGWEKLPEPYRSALPASSRAALASFPPDWPEIEWLVISAYNGNNSNKATADPRDGSNYATLNSALIAPLSRGSVTLAGPDMTTPPVIDPNWLADPTDQALAVQAMRRQRQAWAVLVQLGVADPVEAYPGENVSTDAEILDSIGKSMTTVYHASATCKMGKKGDGMAVVDSQARVFGVQGLRVVDASSFPFLVPGHPQSTVYGFAEKIADEILRGLGGGNGSAEEVRRRVRVGSA